MLGAVKRLDLRLLVMPKACRWHDAQLDRPVRRVAAKPDDIGKLSLEHRIVRNLEPLGDLRPETRHCPFGGKSIPGIDF